MHEFTDAQLVDQFLAHVQPRGELKQEEAAAALSRLGGHKIHQTTISRWVGQGAKRLESHTRDAIATFLQGAEGEIAPAPDDWAALALETVRFAGGAGEWSEAQRRLLRLDLLNGLIRLGHAEGKDVRPLQDELRRLQGEQPPERIAGVASRQGLYELLHLDARAADKRADAAKDLAAAARIEAEEMQARRLLSVSSEEALAVGRAVQAAEDAGLLRSLPVPPNGAPARQESPPPTERHTQSPRP